LDETVKLWDAETGVCLHTLTGHDDEVRGVTYSPQGDMIASFSYDKTVRLWDVASGQCRAVIRDFYGWVLDATWVTGSDFKQLAASCNDGSWSRWSVKEDGNQCQVTQLWRSTNGQLTMTGSIIQDVSGLSQLNKELLKQLGTKGEPDLRKAK
jgi:WD40 repeat protein